MESQKQTIDSKEIFIQNENDVFRARKIMRTILKNKQFGAVMESELEIVISELGTNIVKYAKSGKIIISLISEISERNYQEESRQSGEPIISTKDKIIKIIAYDDGVWQIPPERAMRGGESTSGTLGIGLGAIKRLTDELLIETFENSNTFENPSQWKTKISISKWIKHFTNSKIKFSAFSRPKLTEASNGDTYIIKKMVDGLFVCLIDALGHGSGAAITANVAKDVIECYYMESLDNIILRCHDRLRNTRGAAIALIRVEQRKQKMQYISIGNIEMRCMGSIQKSYFRNFNGTVGMAINGAKMIEQNYEPGSTVVIYSDGIGSFDEGARLLRLSPAEGADYILKKYGRDYDDASIIIFR